MNADTKFWDGIAQSYAASPVKNPAAFEREQAITRQHLRPGSRVLELGAGTGSLALALAPSAEHIVGLDFSAEMLRIAEQRRAAQGVRNVEFRPGTLDGELPFAAGSFDHVWACSILHLVPDRARVLHNAFTLLKPGGTFISSNACLAESWIPYGPAISVMRWFGKAPRVQIYDRATIRRELAQAGFADIVEHDVGAERTIAFIVAKRH